MNLLINNNISRDLEVKIIRKLGEYTIFPQ